MNPEQVRSAFPQLEDGKLIYLDSAATSLKPQPVIDAITQFYARDYATVHRAIYFASIEATNAYEKVRTQVARLIGAEGPEEIVFTRGTTDSINLVAQSLGKSMGPGDEVVISAMEHHSNIVPWQFLAEERKISLKIAPITPDAEIDLKALIDLITPNTRIVSIAHISNASGTVNPIEAIAPHCKKNRALLLVDAAQSIAHIPLDVEELGADLLAFSGHKAFGPTGVGVLYGKKEVLKEMPPVQGGGDMVRAVTLNKSVFQKPPMKFEAGTPPIAQVIGLGAALSFIESIGLEKIHAHEEELTAYATKVLQNIDRLHILGTPKKRGGILSFNVDKAHHLDIGTLLDLEGIALRTGHHCAVPFHTEMGCKGSCRISFSPFNTKQEINRFGEALVQSIKKL